ncbi:Mis6-domain-containing protein [Xylariaceae sp. FL1651]|nr:Mis6-domain-containing protein [Xylariaceae sp. FL1651]
MSAIIESSDGVSAETHGHVLARVQDSFPSLDTWPEMKKLLSDVLQASKLPAKQRGTSVKPTVEKLASLAYDQGLLPADLNELVDLATTTSFLDQASLASIIRSLYPATSVSGDLVIKVVGCLGHGKLKPSLNIQAALLKWLIMIQHIVESRTTLSQTYPVLFNLLETAVLRTYVCHLLALITRRRHVRPHRIQALLLLSKQTGNDPAITGLLRVYKNYYPEIIVGDATRGKALAFKHPDSQWRQRLDEIRLAHARRRVHRSETPLNAFRVARRELNGANGLRIPEAYTSHAAENSITLEEIENVDGFVKTLEKIELPNQLIAILEDPLLQKLLLLRPQAQAYQRAGQWLSSYAQDILSGDTNTSLVDILYTLKSYVTATKNLPPVFLAFLREFMNVWNGLDGRELILDILTYTPPANFQELHTNIFQPLEQKILDGTIQSQLQLLGFFTYVFRRWMVHWASSDQRLGQASQSAADLVAHVNDLCLTLIQTSPCISTQGKVLDFYYQTSSLASDVLLLTHAQTTAIPPAPLIYNLFFGASPTITSRVCSLVAKYKEGFQSAMDKANIDYTPKHISEFNGFLMDICNCLWRQRALSDKDANAKGCLIAQPLVEDLARYIVGLSIGGSLESLFSLSYSPTFSLFAISFLRELEEAVEEEGELDTRHAGPVTRATLSTLGNRGGVKISWNDYRLGVLGYLDSHGMDGVEQLLSKTMTTLLRRMSS